MVLGCAVKLKIIQTRLETRPVTEALKTTVVYSYESLRNDIKLVHSFEPG